eukprot:26343-Pelagococcus_subviridis.AAC.17
MSSKKSSNRVHAPSECRSVQPSNQLKSPRLGPSPAAHAAAAAFTAAASAISSGVLESSASTASDNRDDGIAVASVRKTSTRLRGSSPYECDAQPYALASACAAPRKRRGAGSRLRRFGPAGPLSANASSAFSSASIAAGCARAVASVVASNASADAAANIDACRSGRSIPNASASCLRRAAAGSSSSCSSSRGSAVASAATSPSVGSTGGGGGGATGSGRASGT